MARDPLDLRGKTMTKLQELDAEISSRLATTFEPDVIEVSLYAEARRLLADRCQIRAAMAALRGA